MLVGQVCMHETAWVGVLVIYFRVLGMQNLEKNE